MGVIPILSWSDISGVANMGAKGSSSMGSIGDNTANPFRTKEGWDEFNRRIQLLHGMATIGQAEALVVAVREWEDGQIIGMDQENEYHEIIKANELYAKLIAEDYSWHFQLIITTNMPNLSNYWKASMLESI